MAVSGKVISNPGSGQSIRFIQTSKDTMGRLLEMESVYSAHSTEPVPHFHPMQEEEFLVLEGQINVRLNGTIRLLEPGSKLVVPPGQVHSMWNASEKPARVNWKVKPAMNTEYLLETGMGLAAAGKVNKRGMPSILQTALLMNRYSNVYRIAKIPFILQQLVFGLLTPVALLCGYRGVYKNYIDY